MPIFRRQPDKWREGDPLSATHLNRNLELAVQRFWTQYGERVTQPLDLWARLKEDLDAGDINDPKMADAVVWQKNVSDEFAATSKTEKVVNRESPSYGKDSYIRIRWQDGEWIPYPVPTGGVFAWGKPVADGVDCDDGTVLVNVHKMSFCGDVPLDEAYAPDDDKIVEVDDIAHWFSGEDNPIHTKADIENALWLRIELVYDLTDSYCTSQWVLTFPFVLPGCHN